MMKGINQSGARPVSSSSKNSRDMTGLMMLNRKPITVVSMTKATAGPAPRRRFLAKATVLFLRPEGTKFSPGSKVRQRPVKEVLNSSMLTCTTPRAGSLSTAFFPLKPSSTTKWLKFQWMMQGKEACFLSASTSIL